MLLFLFDAKSWQQLSFEEATLYKCSAFYICAICCECVGGAFEISDDFTYLWDLIVDCCMYSARSMGHGAKHALSAFSVHSICTRVVYGVIGGRISSTRLG